jgi:hypothetical protein
VTSRITDLTLRCVVGIGNMLAVRRGWQLPIAGAQRAEKPDDAIPKS